MKRILITGYYGKGNFGDDILLKTTHGLLKHKMPTAKFFVIADGAQGEYVKRLLPDIETLTSWYRGHFDLIVHGGGGVFFDFEKHNMLARWREKFVNLIGQKNFLGLEKFIRKIFNKPRVSADVRLGFGIGFGTFSPGSFKMLYNLPVLADFEAVWVRDPESTINMRRFNNVMTASVIQGSDLAFFSEYWRDDYHAHKIKSTRPRVGVILRDWEGTDLLQLLEILSMLAAESEITAFIFDRYADSQMEALLHKYNVYIWKPEAQDIADYAPLLANQDVLLTARAHGAICGACLGVPSVIIEFEPKLKLVHEMLPSASVLVSLNNLESWIGAIRHALTITPEAVAKDVEKNRAASETALAQMERYLQ